MGDKRSRIQKEPRQRAKVRALEPALFEYFTNGGVRLEPRTSLGMRQNDLARQPNLDYGDGISHWDKDLALIMHYQSISFKQAT